MKRYRIEAVWAVLLAAGTALGQQEAKRPTFYKDVLPILQENCQECHRPAGTNYGGMVAPMSLMTFDEVRPWAKAIEQQVTARTMPPWHASPIHRGVFKNERSLTDEEIATIARWAQTGAAAGNPQDAPPTRTFENHGGWMIGEPDLIVPMPGPYYVGDDVYDLYAAFSVDLTPEQLPEDMWITAFQCKPGSKFIHHFNCHLLPPDENGKLPPPPDFPDTEKGEIAPSRDRAGQYIGGVASGTDANVYPEGFALPLKKGTRVTFDIHYHKEPGPGTGAYDLSSIGFKLTKEPPRRKLSMNAGSLFFFDINIPPNAPRVQLGPVSTVYRQEAELISLMPHMHMRGAAAKFEAFYPDGTSEVLLDVPAYDFAWQTVYYYDTLKRIPAGTRIEYTAWYDNSPEMAAKRGFDPNQTVKYGQKSTDEMMMGFIMSAAVE